jgi:hypothetical protein
MPTTFQLRSIESNQQYAWFTTVDWRRFFFPPPIPTAKCHLKLKLEVPTIGPHSLVPKNLTSRACPIIYYLFIWSCKDLGKRVQIGSMWHSLQAFRSFYAIPKRPLHMWVTPPTFWWSIDASASFLHSLNHKPLASNIIIVALIIPISVCGTNSRNMQYLSSLKISEGWTFTKWY